MADNYLENQYERYQARKAAWERERKYGKIKKKITRPLPQPNDGHNAPSAPQEETDNISRTAHADHDYSTGS